MLDASQIIQDAIWILLLPLLPEKTATIKGAERIAGFKEELYRAPSDDPTLMLEHRSDSIRNRYTTFAPAYEVTLWGKVIVDFSVKTLKDGTEAFTAWTPYIQRALWSAYPNLGINSATTGLRIAQFEFNASNFRKSREGNLTVFRSPISFDTRISRQKLISA